MRAGADIWERSRHPLGNDTWPPYILVPPGFSAEKMEDHDGDNMSMLLFSFGAWALFQCVDANKDGREPHPYAVELNKIRRHHMPFRGCP